MAHTATHIATVHLPLHQPWAYRQVRLRNALRRLGEGRVPQIPATATRRIHGDGQRIPRTSGVPRSPLP